MKAKQPRNTHFLHYKKSKSGEDYGPLDNKSINSPLPTLHLYDMPCIRVGYTTGIIGKPCSSFTSLQAKAIAL